MYRHSLLYVSYPLRHTSLVIIMSVMFSIVMVFVIVIIIIIITFVVVIVINNVQLYIVSSQILLQLPVSRLKLFGDCAFSVAAPTL